MEVILLGPEGSGKTLLMKHLLHFGQKGRQKWNPVNDLPSHLATCGTNIVKVPVTRRRLAPAKSTTPEGGGPGEPVESRKEPAGPVIGTMSLREVGGAMGPMWDSYYSNAKAVIYVIDAANPFQVAAATILLTRVLDESALGALPLLIAFAKSDIESDVTVTHLKNMMCFDAITTRHVPRIRVVSKLSAYDGTGVDLVYQWLCNL